MTMYTELLKTEGDPIEKEGVSQYDLGTLFPKYAELWAKYVLPNRRRNDRSKLREGFPVELEYVINNHYYIFYQLTVVQRQIRAMPHIMVDVADPLYHLATAVDMVERTFVQALSVKAKINDKPFIQSLSEEDYSVTVKRYWADEYEKDMDNFVRTYRPVGLTFHSIGNIFGENVDKSRSRKKFNQIASNIRNYRNILTHSLAPLKLVDEDGTVKLPKRKYLHLYKHGLWSSEREKVDPEHYAPAQDILTRFWEELVTSLNELWDTLIMWFKDIVLAEQSQDISTPDISRPDSIGFFDGSLGSSGLSVVTITRNQPKDASICSGQNTGNETDYLKDESGSIEFRLTQDDENYND